MRKILWTLVFVLGATPLLYAPLAPGSFINPPEVYWPSQWQLPTGQWITNDWVTDPPYQRNIRLTFDNGLNPWQPLYYGTDDPLLWDSDVVFPGTAFTWFENDAAFHPDGVARRFGLVGIDNRDGNTTIISGINFHVDNWKIDNPCKHMWREMILTADPNVGVVEQLSLPDNYIALDPVRVILLPLADNYLIIDDAVKILPNPPWEELITIVSVPAGSYILIDELHLATECVPEPATVALVTLGLGSLLALRRRRRR